MPVWAVALIAFVVIGGLAYFRMRSKANNITRLGSNGPLKRPQEPK